MKTFDGASTGAPSGPADVSVPGWILRVEGRVIDVSLRSFAMANVKSGNGRIDKARPKFSTFLRSAVVELDQREAPTHPDGNVIEVSNFSLVC